MINERISFKKKKRQNKVNALVLKSQEKVLKGSKEERLLLLGRKLEAAS